MTSVRKNKSSHSCVVRVAVLILVVFAGCCATRFRTVMVIGDSMRPNFSNGDILVVDRLAYADDLPERGDVVIAQARGDIIVKRVVGTPNEQVQVEGGRLYVHGVPFPESDIASGDITIEPGILGKDRFALLGDNRALPAVQMVHAIVAKSDIIGKVTLKIHFGG